MEGFPGLLDWILIAACIGSGMMAGLFSAFSSFMMKALSSLTDSNGIAAMQAINRHIIRPSFLLIFLGTGVLCAASVVVGWGTLGGSLPTAIAATVIYVFGCIVSTVVCNVPLNNQLEAVDPESEEDRVFWTRYLSNWTRWNHVRSVATIVSTGLLALTIATLE